MDLYNLNFYKIQFAAIQREVLPSLLRNLLSIFMRALSACPVILNFK